MLTFKHAPAVLTMVNVAVVLSAGLVDYATAAQATEIGAPGPYSVTIEKSVKYGASASENLIECKATAKNGHFAGPLPAMLLIHGGAWSGGSNAIGPGYTGSSASWCTLWASWGFNTFSVGYRLTGEKRWPAQIVDVQAAIRWVRAHAAALNVNPALIGANGDSAGGQLAMIAGYNRGIIPGDRAGDNSSFNPQAQLVISQFGPWTWGPSQPAGTPSVRAADYAKEMLLAYADGRSTARTPNTLFLQGTKDTTVNQCSQSEPAYKFLKGNDRPTSYLAYDGGHEFTGMNGATWASVVGELQIKTISFAYTRAHIAGVLPAREVGPATSYADAGLPKGCP